MTSVRCSSATSSALIWSLIAPYQRATSMPSERIATPVASTSPTVNSPASTPAAQLAHDQLLEAAAQGGDLAETIVLQPAQLVLDHAAERVPAGVEAREGGDEAPDALAGRAGELSARSISSSTSAWPREQIWASISALVG